MKRLLIVFSLPVLFFGKSYSQESDFNEKNIYWNGYAQIRFTTDFEDNYNFSLRRLKLWLKSTPDFSEHWFYKIQTTLSSIKNETFFLQDVKLAYKNKNFSLDIGQFVPQYSLQRFQPDYLISTVERAKAIDRLIPDGTLGVRDIGIQANIKSKNHLVQSHLGIFNGYGIKEYRLNNKGEMLTNKTSLNFKTGNSTVKAGYSVMYRKANMQSFPKIIPDTVLFNGNDFRYNIFLMFKSKLFEFQAEYLSAFLDNENADGYYFLSSINLNKHQIVIAYENYNDLINETEDLTYFHIGYNYLINSYKVKLFFDNSFQIKDNNIQNFTTSLQLQFFLKQ